MELVINYWFKELAVDEELQDVLLDSFFSWAFVELGWETQIEERVEQFQDENGANKEKKTLVTLADQPFVIRRDPFTIRLDPDARRRKDCRWIGIEEVMTWNDFLASPLYTENAKMKMKPTTYPVDSEEDKIWMGRNDQVSDKEWVKIYTVWDKDTRRIYAVADGYDFLLNSDGPEGEPWKYEIEYKSDPYPLAILDAKRDRMAPYTWSEFKAVEPQILELNRIRSAIQIHVKRSIPKYMYTSAAGTRGKISKLMQARSDEAVELDNLDAFRPFENAPIPPQLFEFNSMSKDDLKTVQGTTQYESQSVADTATEASIIEGRDRARRGQRSKAWEQYVVEIAAKLGMLCQQNMSKAIAVQIAGPKGTEWLNVSKEEIQGEFYFDIEPGIMEYKNETIRKQQLLKFMELTQNDPNVNRRGVILKVAKEMDLEGQDLVLPEDQMPQGEPPKPNIQFKDIDPALIVDPQLMSAVMVAAAQQNGVQIPPEVVARSNGGMNPPLQQKPENGQEAAQAAPLVPLGPSGKDIASAGMNPNGNPALPPVEGNLAEFTPVGV